jgi:gliding motility-associated-like protein
LKTTIIRFFFVLGTFLLLLPISGRATHIVGGEMNYTCLGNDQYEITLTIFRDCYNGNPGAFFDDPASIGVFDGATNLLLQELLIPFDTDLNDTLDPVLSSECFVAPPDVCVHTTTYTTIVTLPSNPGGYTLAYQRCCRNVTITNIVDPLDTGATYSVFISEKALMECNSNPKFNTWPPIYICVNEPISFDQSAVDIDGDSIVYKLCTPLVGANPTDPMPQPPFNPPYDPITWIDPPYNEDNMLNGFPGGDPLEIDEQTGLLTGTPNTIGQFVVGICVEEYRDGELISTTRRDFQYNVGECGQTLSAFFTPSVQCDDLTVDIDNQSSNADEFIWYFNDPANPGAFSTEFEPSYTYADTGTYTIMLIAQPGTICADTSFQEVTLQVNSLLAGFEFDIVECSDSLVLQVIDLTVDTAFTPVEWFYEVSNGLTSTDPNPTFVFTETENIIITLTVTSSNGCTRTVSAGFPVNLIEEELPADTLSKCPEEIIGLNPVFPPAYSYSWSPTSTLIGPDGGNPLSYTTETTTYTVTITDGGFCAIERSITVYVPPPLEVTVPADTVICSPVLLLEGSSNFGTESYWFADPDLNDLLADTTIYLAEPIGNETYYFLVRDSLGCPKVDSVTITGEGVNVSAAPLPFVCLGESTTLTLTNNDPNDILTIDWEPDSLILSGDGTLSPTVLPDTGGLVYFYYSLNNQFDCPLSDSLAVAVVDTSQLDVGVDFTQCSGYSVQFFNTGPNAPFVVWDFGDPTDPNTVSGIQNPTHIYPGPGSYNVQLTLPSVVACPDTLTFEITLGDPEIDLDFAWEYTACSDTVDIQFTNLSTNSQSAFTDIQWEFSTGEMASIDDPSITLTESQLLGATLILTSSDGCIDTLSQEIPIELIEANLADTLIICNQEPTPLNPDFNPEYQYLWSPSTGLDDPTAPNPLANPASTTTYSVIITDLTPDTCEIVRTVTAFVPPPVAISHANDSIFCEESVTLNVTTENAIQVEWSVTPDFQSIFGTGEEQTVSPGQPSYFYVRATDIYGCQVVDTVEAGNYLPQATLNESAFLCIGDTLELVVDNQVPSDILEYDWAPDGSILAGGDGTNAAFVAPPDDQGFSVQITNQYDCTITLNSLVTVSELLPPLFVTADPDTVISGGNSQLQATLDPDYQYSWIPDPTLSATNISNPIATPDSTTTYLVSITDDLGCTNTRTVTVVVLDPRCIEPFVFIPSGFSPNGDGKNDVFQIRGSYIDELYLIIYNRWGEKVFETTDPQGAWDGTFRDEQLPPDVYGYYARILCLGGEEYVRKGNITLIK